MKILKQIIEKKLSLYEELNLNRNYSRSIWQFYSCFNIALAVLNINDEELIRKRNKIWKKWLKDVPGFNEKKFKKIQGYIREDMKIILEALKKIEEINEENPYELGTIDKPFTVGVLSYEFPE